MSIVRGGRGLLPGTRCAATRLGSLRGHESEEVAGFDDAEKTWFQGAGACPRPRPLIYRRASKSGWLAEFDGKAEARIDDVAIDGEDAEADRVRPRLHRWERHGQPLRVVGPDRRVVAIDLTP